MSEFIAIGQQLDTKKKFDLNLASLLVTRLLVTANSGAGKSYLIRKFLEQSHGKVQQIVLDVEGEFATLREKFDYILAGKNADVAATPETAELLARKVLELEANIIIDLYELKHHERILFVRRFLDAMVNAPKELWHSCVVVLDEAHIFAPEKGESQALGSVIDLATRGRKRGFCLIPATQRIAKLHKDVAAECGNKLIGRISLDIDMKRAGEELGFSGKADIHSLRDLEPGQFFAFGPAISKQVTKIQVGAVKTRHPKAGQRLSQRVPVATGKVKAILKRLTDLPKQAEEERQDKESLLTKVRELEKGLRALKREGLSSKDSEELNKLRVVMKTVSRYKKRLIEMLDNIKHEVNLLPEIGGSTVSKYQPNDIRSLIARPSLPLPYLNQPPTRTELGRCERAILKFLAARPGNWFNQSQIGAWTGYSKKSSGFQNALSKLATQHWVIRQASKVIISEQRIGDVRDVLGADYESAASTLGEWKNKLAACPRKIFEQLIENPHRVFHRDEIAAQTGYSTASSGFNNALSELYTLGLMKRSPDGVQLNPEVIGI